MGIKSFFGTPAQPTLVQSPARPDEPKHKPDGKQRLVDGVSTALTGFATDRWVTDRHNNAVRAIADNTYIFKQPIGLKTLDVKFTSSKFHPSSRVPISGEITIETTQPIREFCSVYVLWRKCVPNQRMLNEDIPSTKMTIWTNPNPVKNDQMCDVPHLNLPFGLFAPVDLNVEDFYYEVKIGIGRLQQKGAKPDAYILRKVGVLGDEGQVLPEYK
ncbi:hypothetical protein HK097_009036 [Rhizophlyctis rosea]|uniref:Coat protein n=1 Tax=Rhizophlyctis rosea TaxID=64517 RepID=A0AAD5SJ84_9FUNG|nr:hypothetical protein HK097_009036 [Rhizophlyctis rosea]